MSQIQDYLQEQQMEVEALEAILMDDFKEIHPGESGINTSSRCFQILISPTDDDAASLETSPVQLACIFSHTERYPDESPLLNVKSIRGIPMKDLKFLKDKLEQEALENLGMAMIYTLFTSSKEWLDKRFGEEDSITKEDEEANKDEIIVPRGQLVTIDTFMVWRERFEAEIALERAKLMSESALTISKEKKLTGRQWFESGGQKGQSVVTEDCYEEDEIVLDEEDFDEADEEDMLEHYLASA